MSLVAVDLTGNARSATSIDEQIAKNIKSRRLAAGISQEALALAVGVSYQQVQKWESAKNRISSGRLVTLAAALDCSPIDFFVGIDGGMVMEPTPHFETSLWEADLIKRLRVIPLRRKAVIKNLINEMARDV